MVGLPTRRQQRTWTRRPSSCESTAASWFGARADMPGRVAARLPARVRVLVTRPPRTSRFSLRRAKRRNTVISATSSPPRIVATSNSPLGRGSRMPRPRESPPSGSSPPNSRMTRTSRGALRARRPGARSQPLHPDTQITGAHAHCRVFLALDDVRADMGPTEVVPGTHTAEAHAALREGNRARAFVTVARLALRREAA